MYWGGTIVANDFDAGVVIRVQAVETRTNSVGIPAADSPEVMSSLNRLLSAVSQDSSDIYCGHHGFLPRGW